MSIKSVLFARAGATALAVAALTLAGGAAAEAHVQVIPESTAPGAFTKITLRVPNESDTASTTSLAVNLPTDTPLAEVSVQQMDGWTVKITESKLAKPVEVEGTTITEAPSKVTWTASKGAEIPPGQFREFSFSGGPLPTDVKTLAFPAVQTYSDGTLANWNQPQVEGQEEPEYPMPSFALTAAEAGGDEHAAADMSAAASTSTATATADESDAMARAFGIGGLVVGLLGLAFGGLAWRKAGSQANLGTSANADAPKKVGAQA